MNNHPFCPRPCLSSNPDCLWGLIKGISELLASGPPMCHTSTAVVTLEEGGECSSRPWHEPGPAVSRWYPGWSTCCDGTPVLE